METITIPRRLMRNDDLVVMPRKAYDALIRAQNRASDAIAVKRTMRVPKKYERFYDGVDKQLTESLQEIRAGKVSKSFRSMQDLTRVLES